MAPIRSWSRLLLLVVLLGAAGAVSACEETLRGMGEDTRRNSDSITDAVR